MTKPDQPSENKTAARWRRAWRGPRPARKLPPARRQAHTQRKQRLELWLLWFKVLTAAVALGQLLFGLLRKLWE